MKFIEIVKVYVIGGTISLVVTMIYLFMKAYQNSFKWCFDVNFYSEGKIEAFMIVLYLLSLLILTINKIKNNHSLKPTISH